MFTAALRGTVYRVQKHNDLIGNEAEPAGCDWKVFRVLLSGPGCDQGFHAVGVSFFPVTHGDLRSSRSHQPATASPSSPSTASSCPAMMRG